MKKLFFANIQKIFIVITLVLSACVNVRDLSTRLRTPVEPTSAFVISFLVDINDAPPNWRYIGVSVLDIMGADARSVRFEGSTSVTHFTHQIRIYSDSENALLSYLNEESPLIKYAEWQTPPTIVYRSKSARYRFVCDKDLINKKSFLTCIVLQLQGKVLSVIYTVIDVSSMTLKQVETLVERIDNKLVNAP